VTSRPRHLLGRVRALSPGTRDVLLALVVAALSFTPGISDKGTSLGWTEPVRAFDLIAVLLVLAQCLPLAVRTRAPGPCLALVSAGFFAYQCFGYGPSLASIALYLALYSAGTHQARHRRATEVGWLVGYLVLAGCLVALGSPFPFSEHLDFLPLPIGCWLMGTWARTRLRDQELRQRRELETAMREERDHIARELHDVVTHHVTAMVMQADATRYVPSDDRPRIEAGMSTVGTTGRRALADLRDLLGVLSPGHDAEAAPRTPAAGLFGDLVERTRLVGQPVEVVEDGVPHVVDGVTGLAAHRVVQEGLTNALKHAPGRKTVVRVSHAVPAEVTVEVTTDGGGVLAGTRFAASGRGLAGLHRRVSLAGGELTTKRRDDGGFVLRARLPIRPEVG
jgi:signal transduction histidine kinase